LKSNKEVKNLQKEVKILRSALTELGLALSKTQLDVGARYHMEVFWELLENKISATKN
jgi:hypothetical protein